MLSILLFISGGEIFIILLVILIFFGADKIPEFTRIMGKGVREFRKATDDIKREFHESSSGVIDDLRTISNDVSDSLTKDVAKPVQTTVNETVKTFDDFQDQYGSDFYYDNPYNEYQKDEGAKGEKGEGEKGETDEGKKGENSEN